MKHTTLKSPYNNTQQPTLLRARGDQNTTDRLFPWFTVRSTTNEANVVDLDSRVVYDTRFPICRQNSIISIEVLSIKARVYNEPEC